MKCDKFNYIAAAGSFWRRFSTVSLLQRKSGLPYLFKVYKVLLNFIYKRLCITN